MNLQTKKKWWGSLAAVLLAIAVVAAGCGKSSPAAKDILHDAMEASLSMESYSFSGSMQLDLDAAEAMLEQNPELASILAMVKNAELRYKGVFQKDPMQTEVTLDLEIRGDMSFSLSLPMVITEDTFWIKIPNTPLLAGLFPPELAGKFIRISLDELSEMGGGEVSGPALLDVDAQQRLGLELFKIVADSFDESKYFTVLDKKEAGLPEASGAERAVQFRLTQDNATEALETIVKQALPQMLDLLSKPENRQLLQLNEEDFEQMKQELSVTDEEWQEALKALEESLKLHEFTYKIGVDKNNFMTYQDIKLDLELVDGEESYRVGLTLTNLNERINEKPEFEIGIPAEEDSISLTDLMGGFAF